MLYGNQRHRTYDYNLFNAFCTIFANFPCSSRKHILELPIPEYSLVTSTTGARTVPLLRCYTLLFYRES